MLSDSPSNLWTHDETYIQNPFSNLLFGALVDALAMQYTYIYTYIYIIIFVSSVRHRVQKSTIIQVARSGGAISRECRSKCAKSPLVLQEWTGRGQLVSIANFEYLCSTIYVFDINTAVDDVSVIQFWLFSSSKFYKLPKITNLNLL